MHATPKFNGTRRMELRVQGIRVEMENNEDEEHKDISEDEDERIRIPKTMKIISSTIVLILSKPIK